MERVFTQEGGFGTSTVVLLEEMCVSICWDQSLLRRKGEGERNQDHHQTPLTSGEGPCPEEGQWRTRQDTCGKQGAKCRQQLSLVPAACPDKVGKRVYCLEALVMLTASSFGWQNADDTGKAPKSWIKNRNSIRWPSMGGRQEQLTNFSPLWGFN